MKRKNFSNLKIEVQKEKNTQFEHENYIAGVPPFLRGINSTMYVQQDWISNTLIENSSPNKANTVLKQKIEEGNTNFIFYLNTDNNTGIKVNSTEEMTILFNSVPLNKINITLKTDYYSLAYFAIFSLTINKLGYNPEDLNVTFLHNLHSQRTKKELNLLLTYLANKSKLNWNISIANNFENTIEKELSNLLFESYINFNLLKNENSKINTLASKISFNWNIEKSYPTEIAKYRAARFLWAKLTSLFPAISASSQALKIHVINNNLNDGITAITGGVQSIISTKKDTNFIKHHTYISKTVDPWGGSTIVEEYTKNISINTWNLFLELQKSKAKETIYNGNPNIIDLAIKKAEKKAILDEINEIIEQ
ncbi:Methylmalonyl-CoA mutase [Lutibacter oricola]|uniref:Methylmalonyl-CoA mutase n=1 Tax=Lutibacter oricola TaxID=762486 RepID=A0A1H2YQ50_9FLAO|nr:methylmalonyl-CoA mutase family protein [Lutibacter oricola]SDX06958.1 Methylmalonyl-CoA mutase [Lutibacter oricola]